MNAGEFKPGDPVIIRYPQSGAGTPWLGVVRAVHAGYLHVVALWEYDRARQQHFYINPCNVISGPEAVAAHVAYKMGVRGP